MSGSVFPCLREMYLLVKISHLLGLTLTWSYVDLILHHPCFILVIFLIVADQTLTALFAAWPKLLIKHHWGKTGVGVGHVFHLGWRASSFLFQMSPFLHVSGFLGGKSDSYALLPILTFWYVSDNLSERIWLVLFSVPLAGADKISSCQYLLLIVCV